MTTFVLVHGSWHGGWCWHKVASRLERAGHTVFAPDLPAHGRDWRAVRGLVTLRTLVDSIVRILDSREEPAIVVAHSRGGIVASRVAELRPRKVQKLVYLASYMLRDGERVLEQFQSDRGSMVPQNLEIDRLRGTDMLREDAYREALYADCDDADYQLAKSLLTPEPSLPALTRLRLSPQRYGSIPRYYVELTRDRAVSPELQRRLYAAQPCERVFAVDASHSAYFSRPDELSEIFRAIAS